MTSTHEANLDIPKLPDSATRAHIVPELQTHSLLSLGQFCDSGCTATIDQDTIDIFYQNEMVLSGQRSPDTTLWHIEYPIDDKPKIHYTNNAIGRNTTANIVAFMHAAFFSPVLSTLYKALKLGYITHIPGLTAESLKKHPPQSFAMVKGHLNQTRKNVRSTKTTTIDTIDNFDDFHPPQLTDEDKQQSNYCYAATFEPTGKMYSDQTGQMVAPSSKGNNYIFIMYDYDSNAILAEPMQNRKAESLLAAYKKVHQTLRSKGMSPKIQMLDNECPQILKNYMTQQNIKYQLATPGQHRANAAERAIQTFKNHFIAGLCTTDPHFPIHLWDRLLEQATLTLNLMRGSRINPKHSAWSQLFGPYDFNATPLAPPGIRVLIHEKPDKRATFAPHAIDGWYIGPAREHYRCYKVFVWETQAERITDTISWFPTQVKLPTATSEERIAASLQDVVTELQQPRPPFSTINLNESQSATLINVTNILSKIIQNDTTNENEDDIIDDVAINPELDVILPGTIDNDTTVLETSTDKVQSEENVSDDPDTSQRVEDPLTSSPIPIIEDPAPAQRVPPLTVKGPRRVTFDQLPIPHAATYTNPKIKGMIESSVAKNKVAWPHPRKLPPPQATHHHFTRQSAKCAYVLEHNPHFCLYGNAINPDTGLPAEYLELSLSSDGLPWQGSMSEEVGRLVQGNGSTVENGYETMRFLPITEIPRGTKITYARIVVADRPEKANPRRVRITIGGNLVVYMGVTSTKAAELPTVKIFINSVLSTPKARMMTMDLKDFFLMTAKMDKKDFAYMRMALNLFPPDIIEKYNLHTIAKDGFVYIEVSKGMYGLPQAGRLANEQLIRHLAPHGYAPCAITPGLWKHESRDIQFLLVVDDFAVKYTNRQDVEHLISALKTGYKLSIDWDAERYCGLILKWDYNKRTCDVSMPGYIERALARFEHPTPKKPQHNPFRFIQPEYGAKIQYEPDADTTPEVNAKERTRIQEILGTLLYYARAVDPTMLVTISSLSTKQAKPTTNTMLAVKHLLDYAATHPNATIRYHASDMVLHVESDASYLSEENAKSRFAGFHYCSDDPKGENIPFPPINGPVLVTANIIKETVSSAAEAELAALFHNAQEALPLRHALIELGHPQPPSPMQTDNSTAAGLANDTVKQKRSKAMNMRWFWVRDLIDNKTINVYWNAGKSNRADYFSKQHPTKHHMDIRSTYLHTSDTETNAGNYFDRLTKDEEALLNALDNPSTPPTDCGKGVLISSSGLPNDSVSKDPQSEATYDPDGSSHLGVTERADGYSDLAVPLPSVMVSDKIDSPIPLFDK
jgi:hypothetical protein